MKITIRGVEYSTQREAAKKLGLHTSTIHKAKKDGRLDTVGILKQPIVIRGVEYESQVEAAKAIGVKASTIGGALERGTLDYCGLGKRNKRPIVMDGVEYPSTKAAADVIGVRGEALACYALRKRQKGVYEFEYKGHKIKQEPRND